MAITKPVLYTPIEDLEVSFTRPNADEVVRKIAQNLNLLGELAKIGSIRTIATNQPGATVPDSVQFQRADGDEITNPTSPLRTTGLSNRFTPDMRDRYIRGANALTDIFNELGGTPFVNLSHTHVINAVSAATLGEEGDEQVSFGAAHSHPLGSALNSPEPLEPSHQQVDVYLKIN